ncbi:MAG: TRM11 family SAM-dependent methyltransferase [Thermodesulfobacteriota bacterium]
MKTDQELYRQLRVLSPEKLWNDEVTRFDQSPPEEKIKRVAVIRAVGVVFSESGTPKQKDEVRSWLVRLLRDPSEKVRRYAMTALPKLGAGTREEGALLSLMRTTTVERERKFLGQALEKIGGKATLDAAAIRGVLPQTEQKVKASVARRERPSAIRMEGLLLDFTHLRIHLHCRMGLEEILRDEVKDYVARLGKFRILKVQSGLVAITPVAAFSLADIYTLRCFATVGFFLGHVRSSNPTEAVDALASAITSPVSRTVLTAFTEGSIRYRLEFVSKGHQRGAVRLVTNRAYEMCPEILNDPRSAPWSMDLLPTCDGISVELRPKLTPDPRFTYRKDDIRAASHPPLAACMARLGGRGMHEIVWDPFCGSGLELIERALLGGVERIYGTDLSPDAISACRANFAAANVKAVPLELACCDFRGYAKLEGLGPKSVTLIITNPPMGKRVRVPSLRGLIRDLFDVAAVVLKPGGRLIFANPLRIEPQDPSLKLKYRKRVDLGGFNCRLEMYLKEIRPIG